MTSLDKLPSLILKGTKILTLEYRDVKLIDSYNFIPISLERFPETFGLKELKKGFFPHSFNSPENFNYIGSIPSKSFFSANFFSENKKKNLKRGTKNKQVYTILKMKLQSTANQM